MNSYICTKGCIIGGKRHYVDDPVDPELIAPGREGALINMGLIAKVPSAPVVTEPPEVTQPSAIGDETPELPGATVNPEVVAVQDQASGNGVPSPIDTLRADISEMVNEVAEHIARGLEQADIGMAAVKECEQTSNDESRSQQPENAESAPNEVPASQKDKSQGSDETSATEAVKDVKQGKAGSGKKV